MAGNVGYYRPTGFLTISTVSAFYQELDDLKQPTAGSVGSVISRRATSAPEQGRSNQQSCRNPNPEEFTLENGRTATRERSSDTYWRYSNRSPGKKVRMVTAFGNIRTRAEFSSITFLPSGLPGRQGLFRVALQDETGGDLEQCLLLRSR